MSSKWVFGAVVTAGLLVVVASGAGDLDGRVGLRNAVYATFATALLVVVLVDAVQHRSRPGDEHAVVVDGGSVDVPDIDAGSLLPELRLAARLGSALVGEQLAA